MPWRRFAGVSVGAVVRPAGSAWSEFLNCFARLQVFRCRNRVSSTCPWILPSAAASQVSSKALLTIPSATCACPASAAKWACRCPRYIARGAIDQRNAGTHHDRTHPRRHSPGRCQGTGQHSELRWRYGPERCLAVRAHVPEELRSVCCRMHPKCRAAREDVQFRNRPNDPATLRRQLSHQAGLQRPQPHRGRGRRPRSTRGRWETLGDRVDRGAALGCGPGELDWHDVRPRIERAFSGVPEVHALLFEPIGAPASEKMAKSA